MALKIIAAIAANGVIGMKGRLPWRLSGDLEHFKNTTGSLPVVMGSKTFHSLPARFKPLPGRENIVLTRHADSWKNESGATPISSFDEVVERAKSEEIFVIGGAKLYELALPVADELYLTRVQAAPAGDTFFPNWDEKQWTRVKSKLHLKDGKNEHDFITEHYLRRSSRYLEMKNIRDPVQLKDMTEIHELGICPFCRDFLNPGDSPSDRQWHTQPLLWRGNHWVATRNKYPYPWTKEWGDTNVHLLLVLRTHAETITEMPQGAFEEIGTILRWAENKFNIEGGALFLRFGEPLWTGGTVRHIHAHIAQRRDLETPAAFYLSSFVGEKKTGS